MGKYIISYSKQAISDLEKIKKFGYGKDTIFLCFNIKIKLPYYLN